MRATYNHSIKVLIADDHEIVREGFHTMFAKTSNVNVVGEAKNGKELLTMARRLQPDVIITDIRMPVMDGIEATRRVTSEFPAIPVIAFTMFDEENLIVDMIDAGIQGYLLKSSSKSDIIEAIQSVHMGNTYYCRSTTPKMARIIAASRRQEVTGRTKDMFSDKELTIICLICEGLANKEMAAKLNLSIRTIEGHRERIQEKMKTHNTAGIVVFAIKEGLFNI